MSDKYRTCLFQRLIQQLYRGAKDGEIIGILVENMHINRLEINLECVIITFNHECSVFSICCGPWSILIPDASGRSTKDRNKH